MSSWWSTMVIFYILKCNLFVIGERDENNWLTHISKDTDLSEFYGMLERDTTLKSNLPNYAATIFVPTNEAFQKYKNGEKDNNLLMYHIVLSPYKTEQLPTFIVPNFVPGNPQLRITRINDNVFVNNAKIIPEHSKVFNKPDESKRKILHYLDEVLQPLMLKGDDPAKENPNALGLLESSNEYKLGQYQLHSFAYRVRANKKEDIFRDQGPNTYLIPVDDLVKKPGMDMIDEKVIDAHVIPRQALFLKPTPYHEIFKTIAFGEFFKVTVSFPGDVIAHSEKRYVKSHTVLGDPKHPSGVVLSEVVFANIPVQNGVVHLIRQPLAIIDKTIQQFIENTGGPFSNFKDKFKYASDQFRSKLNSQQGITLFIPSDVAWKDPNVQRALSNNNSSLTELLNLHIISEKLNIEILKNRGTKSAATLYKKKYLYFNLITEGSNETLSVEGGGVNATVIYADIAATNGIIHVIDRVLGIPYATVGRKVATDPQLNTTYMLGKYQNFNNRLDDISQNYTYFVPRDAAWQLFSVQQPSFYNAVTKSEFAYQVLEKHLVISGNYTMSDLKKIANDTYLLPTARGGLSIRVRDDVNGYIIEWNNERVRVDKADVRCTNGIVHVIDRVLITPNDIKVPINGAMKNYLGIEILLLITLPFGMMVFYH